MSTATVEQPRSALVDPLAGAPGTADPLSVVSERPPSAPREAPLSATPQQAPCSPAGDPLSATPEQAPCSPAGGPSPAMGLGQPLPAAPPLRLLPAPISDPPYDDERGGPLPLRAPGAARPRLRLLRTPDPAPEQAALDLPPAAPFARSLVQRLLEVIAGVRPLSHLRRDTTLAVYEQLENALQARPRANGARPDGRAVRSIHTQLQGGGHTVEVSATVRRDGRYGAIALRLEGAAGAWTCTELVGA